MEIHGTTTGRYHTDRPNHGNTPKPSHHLRITELVAQIRNPNMTLMDATLLLKSWLAYNTAPLFPVFSRLHPSEVETLTYLVSTGRYNYALGRLLSFNRTATTQEAEEYLTALETTIRGRNVHPEGATV